MADQGNQDQMAKIKRRQDLIRLTAVIGSCLFFLMAGPALAIFAIVYNWAGAAAASWPTVDGVMTKSQLNVSPLVIKNSRIDHVVIQLEYAYEVDGKKYTGRRRTIGDMGDALDRRWAENKVASLPVGKFVTVYYSREKPELAVLEPGNPEVLWVFAVAGLLSIALGVAMAILARVLYRRMGNAGESVQETSEKKKGTS